MTSVIKKYGVRPVDIHYEPSPDNPHQLLRVRRQSDMSGKVNQMDLPIVEQHLRDWLDGGKLIQHVMPHLSKDQREFLVSGSTPEEWEAVFGKEEEE